MGEKTVKELELENGIGEWSLENYRDVFINKYLKEAGAEPEIIEANDEKIVYRLHNCVFFELAIKMTEMICDIVHEGFHEGVSNAMGNKMKISRLSCMGKGDPYCEHVCELLTKKEEK